MTRYSSLASVKATRERLEELGLSTKKYFGQHFLIDDGVVGKIIRLADIDSSSVVVEVGPGLGTLTEALLATEAGLTAVELDKALWEGLSQRYPSLHLVRGDALAPDSLASLQAVAPTSLVANLPYAVAATLILEYLQVLPSLRNATVMVQREVADRIMAKPGTKEYGSYTIKLRLLAKVTEWFKVSRQSFFPPPRVDSAVIRLERCSVSDELINTASMLADAAFFQRRKTLANSIRAYCAAHGRDDAAVMKALEQAGIDPGLRGETLPPEIFIALAHALL